MLLPFAAQDLPQVIPEVASGHRSVKTITFAEAKLNDGQSILGVNDLFIGQKGHASARYGIALDGKSEAQSSSGVIVSTGLGKTGWLKSILAGAQGIDSYFGRSTAPKIPADFDWSSDYLFYTVREPYPSTSTGAAIVFGTIRKQSPLQIVSYMPEDGVIFSDGVQEDCLEFNSGAIVTIGVAQRTGKLVV